MLPDVERTGPWAATLLRAALGVLFLAHGVLWKLVQTGPQHVIPWFVSQGYAAWFGWAVIAIEAAGGLALLLGWRTRWACLFLAVFMAGIARHQFPNGWIYTSQFGGWEYPAFWAVALLVQAGLGPGRLALDNRRRGPAGA
jgi:putative oxidoreductase